MHKQIFLKVPFRIECALELLYVRQGYVMAGNVGDRVRLPMPSLHNCGVSVTGLQLHWCPDKELLSIQCMQNIDCSKQVLSAS